jgi:hypothetical protein
MNKIINKMARAQKVSMRSRSRFCPDESMLAFDEDDKTVKSA